jgi:anti-sigma regulatory factor (Ser/Thr protein kinase)
MEVKEQSVAQSVVEVGDLSLVGEARRTAVRLAEQMGMGEGERGSIAIAVSEMASNLVKHAMGGRILCEQLSGNGTRGLRVLAIDKGPGIRNISAALADGHSTAGTGGNGLGAIQRLATVFDIYSLPRQGTGVLAEFWPNRKAPSGNPFWVGGVSTALRGEAVCGDAWLFKTTRDTAWLMVADGLGHGVYAAEAAREANRILAQAESGSPASIMRDCHDALRKTRGAAAAIAMFEREKSKLCFAGLGNISAVLVNRQGCRRLASYNGTLGHQMSRLQEFTFPWADDSTLVMHSDGLATRWNLDDYPGILNKHPSLIAAVLYRDFSRELDDVTVLVTKNSEQ